MLVNRYRNNKRVFKITQDDYDRMELEARLAYYILDKEKGKPLKELLDFLIKDAEYKILNNVVQAEQTEGLVDGVKKIFVRTRKENQDVLAGEYKAYRFVRDTLQAWIDSFEEYKRLVSSGEVKIVNKIDD